MECSYKFRIYPNSFQIKLIQQTFGSVRFVYNYYLAKRKELWEKQHVTFSCYDCSKDFTKLRKEIEWLQIPDVTALRSSIEHLDAAFENFFRGLKNKQYIGYPKFKSKKNNLKSYESKNSNHNTSIRIEGSKIRLPKLGLVKCKISKQVKGRILHATVIQKPSGKYYISLSCTDVEFEQFEKSGNNTGVDLGIKDLIVLSDGTKFQNHKYLEKSEKKLATLQRALSRKSNDSKRKDKARIKIAKLYEHISNQRRDTIQKITTNIIKKYDVVCIEDLDVKNMEKDHLIAKLIIDTCFGEIKRELEYKAKWYEKQIIKIDRYFPSSQICSCCGAQNKELKNFSIREWTCPSCFEKHDRDINAAKNILIAGLAKI